MGYHRRKMQTRLSDFFDFSKINCSEFSSANKNSTAEKTGLPLGNQEFHCPSQAVYEGGKTTTIIESGIVNRTCNKDSHPITASLSRKIRKVTTTNYRAELSAKRSISKCAVVGAGTMGNGIAHVFALKDHSVDLADVFQTTLARAMVTIGESLSQMMRKEKVSTNRTIGSLHESSHRNSTAELCFDKIPFGRVFNNDFQVEAYSDEAPFGNTGHVFSENLFLHKVFVSLCPKLYDPTSSGIDSFKIFSLDSFDYRNLISSCSCFVGKFLSDLYGVPVRFLIPRPDT